MEALSYTGDYLKFLSLQIQYQSNNFNYVDLTKISINFATTICEMIIIGKYKHIKGSVVQYFTLKTTH